MRALAILLLVGTARVAAADCGPTSVFAETERAARVLVVEVKALGGGFTARFAVKEVLKGAATPRELEASFNPMSGESFAVGGRYLVFADAKGALAGGCSAVDLHGKDAKAIVDGVRAWPKAGDAARVALLVEHARSSGRAGRDALAYLGARPDLLAAVSPAQRTALVKTIPVLTDERAYGLAWVLGRLRAVEAVPAYVALLEKPAGRFNSRPIQDGLELLTNHHDPAYTPGHDFYGEQAATLREGWTRWYAAHGKEPVQVFVDAGYRERGEAPLPLGDRAALAARVRTSKDVLSRTVAIDVCEQARKASTSHVSGWSPYVEWAKAADACAAP